MANKGVIDLNAYTASNDFCFSGLFNTGSTGVNGQTYSHVRQLLAAFSSDLGLTTTFIFSGSVGTWNIINNDPGRLHVTMSNGMKQLLGFSGSKANGLSNIPGDVLPWFVWKATIPGYGEPYSGQYEGYNTWHDAWSRDSSRKYSLGNEHAIFEDWSWQAEPTSNVFEAYTGSYQKNIFSTYPLYTSPHFTWQRLVVGARSMYPLVVISSSLDMLTYEMRYGTFQLTDEGSIFQDQVHQDGYIDEWDLVVKVNRIGA